MQEDDCDVCKLLRKILQRIEQVEERLSSIERANHRTIYDPRYLDMIRGREL
jgi:hypothetical protein